MALRVTWSLQAATELELAAEFVSEVSPKAAADLVRSVIDGAARLSIFPQQGRTVPEFADRDLREIFVQRYRLLYRSTPDQILILTLIHMSRELREHKFAT